MEFKRPFGDVTPPTLPLDYDFNPIDGFQEHAAEPIARLLQRLSFGGDVPSFEVVDDEDFFDGDYFDMMDVVDVVNAQSDERPTEASAGRVDPVKSGNRQQPANGDSESSHSGTGLEPPLGEAQKPVNDNAGDSEIAV